MFLVRTDRLETNPDPEGNFTRAPSGSPKTRRKLLLSKCTWTQCSYSGLYKPVQAPKFIRGSRSAEHIGKLMPAVNNLGGISDAYIYIEIGKTCASMNVEAQKSTLTRDAKTRISMENAR
jgi:hypothetical protein